MEGYLGSFCSACGHVVLKGQSAVKPDPKPPEGRLGVLSAWRDCVDSKLVVYYTGRRVDALLSSKVNYFLLLWSKCDLVSLAPRSNLS